MPPFLLKTTECRVGVVGTYSAGKTVFLTSLVNHLQDYDPSRFPLGDPARPARVRKFRPLPPDPGWAPFPYDACRAALVEKGRWPRKTRDRSQYVCRFERDDWRWSDCLLKLHDLPGERVADAAMLGRSFAAWSDHVLPRLAGDPAYRACSAPFLDAVAAGEGREVVLLHAYRLALANLISNFKPLVTPSTFLLDMAGDPAGRRPAAELATSRASGLSDAEQFCPLPPQLRVPGSALLGAFTARYDRYVELVVVPTIRALKSCTALVILVDVTMLLAGGVGMYDDSRAIVKDLLDVLNPGEHPVFGPIGRGLGKVFLPHDWRPGWITRLAFVAPKMDLVHPVDRDHMLGLLRQMVGRYAADHDGLRYDFFNCAAMAATKVRPGADGERLMVGVPYRDPAGNRLPPGAEQRFAVSELPAEWPPGWPPGRYSFPEVYPQMPARKDHPPDQVNLDRVASFVID